MSFGLIDFSRDKNTPVATLNETEWLHRTRAKAYQEAEAPLSALRQKVQEAVIQEADKRDEMWQCKLKCPYVEHSITPQETDSCWKQFYEISEELQKAREQVEQLSRQCPVILKATIESVRRQYPVEDPAWKTGLPEVDMLRALNKFGRTNFL